MGEVGEVGEVGEGRREVFSITRQNKFDELLTITYYLFCKSLKNYGSTQRPSVLMRLINSSTPCDSGTFLISSRPRYKEI